MCILNVAPRFMNFSMTRFDASHLNIFQWLICLVQSAVFTLHRAVCGTFSRGWTINRSRLLSKLQYGRVQFSQAAVLFFFVFQHIIIDEALWCYRGALAFKSYSPEERRSKVKSELNRNSHRNVNICQIVYPLYLSVFWKYWIKRFYQTLS